MLTIRMLGSPAYQVLSLTARRVLDRLEIEHANQGGYENGKLTVTYDQFVEFGIHRTAVAPAIRELEMLGFIVVTQRGLAGIAEHRRPNKFMLTYLPADGVTSEHGKGDWRSVDTVLGWGEQMIHSRSTSGDKDGDTCPKCLRDEIMGHLTILIQRAPVERGEGYPETAGAAMMRLAIIDFTTSCRTSSCSAVDESSHPHAARQGGCTPCRA